MAEENFSRPLSAFDMQGQSIKDVVLKKIKIEEVDTLPSASDNYHRILFYKGEIKYSDGDKWIGQYELVSLGLEVKTNLDDNNIPKGQIEINGHRVTLFNKIDNSDLALMPTKTIKGNRTDSDASPTDITYANLAKDMRDSTLLGVTLTKSSGVYILSQGDVEIGRFSTEKFVDDIKLVSGTWLEEGTKFEEDESGTDIALKLIIKKELEDDSFIYLDVSKLMNVYLGGETDTINVVTKQTEEGYKILAEIKEKSIKKEHLSTELYAEIEEAISSAQIQADWNQTDATQKDFIKNKPTHLPSPNNSITTEQLQVGVVTNDKLTNKTINFNGQTFELGAKNQNLAPLKNTGFEVVESLPTTNNFEGRQVVYQGRTYTFYNGKYQCVADDLGGRDETRQEQFTFQPTANDESVKDGLAVVKSIKGNTIVANQIIEFSGTVVSGTADFSSDKIRIESTSKSCNLPINIKNFKKNHKYFFSVSYYFYCVGEHGDIRLYLTNSNEGFGWSSINSKYITPNTLIKDTAILTATNDFTSTHLTIGYNYPIGDGNYVDLYNYVIIDLTQMFGEGNEPATVEDFERLYPNLPTEYNEGSLLNLNAEAIKSVGFNAFNGEYAQVLGGMQYYLGGIITSLTFKENLEDEGDVIEIPSDKLYIPNTNGYLVAEGSDICINLSHSGYRNGEYEPYKEFIVNLPIKEYFSEGLKSAGVIKDEIVWDEGLKKYKAIQRIGTRVYQTGDEDLADVKTDKTNTYYILETPVETIIDDYVLIDYEVSDFGTEEILFYNPTTPIVADIQYGFNAVDEIRNHRFEIKDLKKKSNQQSQLLNNIKDNVTNVDDKVIEINTKLEDLDTIRTNASKGNTAYGWGNHANAGYAKKTELMHQHVTSNLSGMAGMIGLDEHKCGVSPIVQAYLNGTQVLCEISNDGEGNISWASNIVLTEDSNFKLVIIGNPNESNKLI